MFAVPGKPQKLVFQREHDDFLAHVYLDVEDFAGAEFIDAYDFAIRATFSGYDLETKPAAVGFFAVAAQAIN